MKKVVCVLLSSVLVLSCAAGCQSQDDKPNGMIQKSSAVSSVGSLPDNSATTQADGKKSLSGELTISAAFPEEIRRWASKFQAVYPDVTVTVEGTFDAEDSVPEDWPRQYAQITVPELASGESADIVEVGALSFYKYAKSNLFMDYYELMENDPDFHKDDYYINIFQALEAEDGGLYALPLYFTYKMLILNDYMLLRVEPDLDTKYKDGISYNDVVALFQQGREMGEIPEDALFSENQNKLFFDDFVLPKFLDEKTGEARFDSPAFIEYLEKTDTLPYDTKVGDAVTAATDLPDFLPDNFFCQQVPLGVYTVQYFTANRRLAGQSTPLFYRDEEGDAPFSASRLWAIPKGGNTELAWEFMKFVVEEKEFPSSINPESVADYLEYFNPYAASIPINRNNFLHLYGAAFDKRLADDADAYNQTLNMRTGISSELTANLMDILEGYYNSHLISAEECARQMQDRAWIYLNE